MTMTEFAMVEELACLIKDNLSCKHLILSTEEALVDFLQKDTSPDGVLELEPMNPYHRLLLHRLADIFGFVHESVGEGDDRHLILERCAESTIPSILVSDILLEYDEYQSPTTSTYILRRKEALPASETRRASFTLPTPVEEREAAYLAARERIFSFNEDDDGKKPVASKPRNIPVVARRMIAHALGQKLSLENSREDAHAEELKLSEKTEARLNSTSDSDKETTHSSGRKLRSSESKGHSKSVPRRRSLSTNLSSTQKGVDSQPSRNGSPNSSMLQNGSSGRIVGKEDLKREQFGAAKRMFTHALGLPSGKGNQGLLLKCNEGRKALGQQEV